MFLIAFTLGPSKRLKCLVKSSGKLFDHSIVHLPHVPLEVTELLKDNYLNFGIEQDVDIMIISNVKSASLILNIRTKLKEGVKKMLLFARIEDMVGVLNIDDILTQADGIVIARGELGITLPPEKLFIVQKSICAKCNKVFYNFAYNDYNGCNNYLKLIFQLGKPVIVSTHILKSMNGDRIPFRSEILDVSNAILDGVDCLQLTEEVMLGSEPIKCIQMLGKMCKEAEAAVFQPQLFNNLSSMVSCFK